MASDARRPPAIGDTVLYQGHRATVTAVYPEGASFLPASKVMPVDLVVPGGSWGGLPHSAAMIGFGPHSGWSWPDDDSPRGDVRDET